MSLHYAINRICLKINDIYHLELINIIYFQQIRFVGKLMHSFHNGNLK